jgi:similar to stage IV sporulation protein
VSFQRFWSWLAGFLVIRIEGEAIEKFINMAASRGIYLWDIMRLDSNTMVARVRLSGLRPLRHIRRRVGCRFCILDKQGLPFYLWKMRRRKLLTTGAILFVGTLYALASFVWFVEITGTNKIPEVEIRQALVAEGLHPGVWKRNIDLNAVGKGLTRRVCGLAWAGVEMQGTRVIVKVVEKVLPPAKPSQDTADVVAKREGLVTQLLVLTGEAAVQPGDVVRPGQVLISGELRPSGKQLGEATEGSQEEVFPLPSRQVSARGIVRARTWHQGYGEAVVVEKGVQRSGVSVKRISIKWGKEGIIIKGPKIIPFASAEQVETRKNLPSWRNIGIPVEIVNTVYHELVPYSKENGLDGARRLALQMAMAKIKPELSPQAKILSNRVEELRAGEGNLVQLRLTLETIEDIGQVQYRKLR